VGDISWADLAYTIFLVLCMGLVLGVNAMRLDESYAVVRAQMSRYKQLATAELGHLEKEKNELEQQVDAVRKFLDTRVLWTPYTRDIPVRLPANARLSLLTGINPWATSKKAVTSASDGSFMLRATAPCAEDGATPREIDTFLNSLRNHPLLKHDFPSIELADIRQSQSRIKGVSEVAFTVICLPKSTKGPPVVSPASGGKEKTEHK